MEKEKGSNPSLDRDRIMDALALVERQSGEERCPQKAS